MTLPLGAALGALGLSFFFVQAFAAYFYTGGYDRKIYLAAALAALYSGVLLMLMFTTFAARCKDQGWLKKIL